MRFTAKRITLEIEVEPFDGTVANLSVPNPISAEAAAQILERIIQEESDFRKAVEETAEGEEGVYTKAVNLIASQLSALYGTTVEFWKSNFDKQTLSEIKKYVVDELSGTVKKP